MYNYSTTPRSKHFIFRPVSHQMNPKINEKQLFAEESEYPYPYQLPDLSDPIDNQIWIFDSQLNRDSELEDSLHSIKSQEDLNKTEYRIIDSEPSQPGLGMQLPTFPSIEKIDHQSRPFHQHIFQNQIIQRKSSRRLQANILEHIINEKIKELIVDDSVDQQIKDHNRKVLNEKRLHKLKILVGLHCGYSDSKQRRIYDFNRKIIHQALTNRSLLKKIVIQTDKIKKDHQRMEYLRQIKVYSHRIKSQLISTRIQSK